MLRRERSSELEREIELGIERLSQGEGERDGGVMKGDKPPLLELCQRHTGDSRGNMRDKRGTIPSLSLFLFT